MPDAPTASQHAALRWVQYADPDADPELAWEAALPLSETGLHGDEARYSVEHDVILIRKNAQLTTIIDHHEGTRPEARAAVEVALAKASEGPTRLR